MLSKDALRALYWCPLVPIADAPVLRVVPNLKYETLNTPFRVHVKSPSGSFSVPIASAAHLGILTCIPNA